jgi:threonine synthase
MECIACQQHYDLNEVRYSCDCGGLLAIERPSHLLKNLQSSLFDHRLTSRADWDVSGVWRFREAILDLAAAEIVTHPEGGTHLYQRPRLSEWAGVDELYLKHEGENPSGSFKDRGMTVAVSQAKRLGAKVVVCASTGNTSSALAAYAAQAGLQALVLLPSGRVASGKMAQAIGYGARCLAIKGNFDAAMNLVRELTKDPQIYMVNSLNPFRLEGQKSIIWEILQNLKWSSPDWIVVPGGNLGNTSAFGKAIHEAYEAGWIRKKPRLATIQAHGANPFFQSFAAGFSSYQATDPETVATAIRIGNPVNYEKAKRMIQSLDGVVTEVTDEAILEAKAIIDRQGIGCEPASACSLAGTRKLVEQGVIKPQESVVGILTGHMLKDPDVILKTKTNIWEEVDENVDAIRGMLPIN